MKRSIFLTVIFGLSLISSNIAKAITNHDVLNWAFVLAGLYLANTVNEDLEKIGKELKARNEGSWYYQIFGSSNSDFLNNKLLPAFKQTLIFRTIPGLALAGYGAYQLFWKK